MTRVLRSVALKNYKSIASCRVDLAPLTLLIGPNGAGKSNFVDAIRLVADALNTTLDDAIREHGGLSDVRMRSTGHPHDFTIRLTLALPDGRNGLYAFQVGGSERGNVVKREKAMVSGEGLASSSFETREGEVVTADGLPSPPPVARDRLYLTMASALPAFRPLFETLRSLDFFSLDAGRMKMLAKPESGDRLRPDGSNVAAVLRVMAGDDPRTLERITDYLRVIVPGVDGVEQRDVGPMETVVFLQEVLGAKHPWRFYASAMSDGPLRSLGVLVALFQRRPGAPGGRFAAIEEPERTIHPAAATCLMDAFLGATAHTQVLATTHSPDLLDHPDLDAASLIAVEAEAGRSMLGPIDPGALAAVRERLTTPGELLRQSQLQPAPPADRGRMRTEDLFVPTPS